jgi:predicted dehydrogenase
MTTSPLRVAMIGAGSMANAVHYPSLASFDDVAFAGICDLDAERLTSTADRFGIEARYSDYRRMVDETAPDAVYAIGDPDVMFPVWVWCLQHGLNLYIEKPMGFTAHLARTLAHLAERNGCITQVSFQRRTCPMVVMLRDECVKRGPITHAVCEFYKCDPTPDLSPRGRIMDDGIHALDTIRWMCGGEVTSIWPVTRRVMVPDLNFMSVLLEFDSGATGAVLCSWSSGRRVFRVQMHAPGICVEAEHEGKGVLYADGDTQGVWFDTGEVAGSDQLWGYAGFRDKNREFVDCVRARRQPGSRFGDAVKTMELADRVLAMDLLARQG